MMKRKKGQIVLSIILWVIAAFFLMTFLVYIPHVSSFLALIVAVLIAPINQWQNFINEKTKIKRGFKIAIIIVMVIVTFIAIPVSEESDSNTLSDNVTGTTNAAIIEPTTADSGDLVTEPNTEMVTEETVVPTTEVPTEEPTEPITEAPTQAPTEPTTQTPTKPPAEQPTQAPTEPTTQTPTKPPAEQPTTDADDEEHYVLNTNTKKFHHPHCRSVKKIDDKNRDDFYGSREKIIDEGYEPCGICDP